ncbi:hypothetical protein [Shewanella chilikensis]|uniref:hypothetical protein n=1 Tax=Shewanella chilikensis TaxID=558541 RepID=UPI001F3F92BA|nr:hypothetical protein [Shewanella chilikensis]MCE9788996.1 hypothetical protein [Shewanella chilikensis]
MDTSNRGEICLLPQLANKHKLKLYRCCLEEFRRLGYWDKYVQQVQDEMNRLQALAEE